MWTEIKHFRFLQAKWKIANFSFLTQESQPPHHHHHQGGKEYAQHHQAGGKEYTRQDIEMARAHCTQPEFARVHDFCKHVTL